MCPAIYRALWPLCMKNDTSSFVCTKVFPEDCIFQRRTNIIAEGVLYPQQVTSVCYRQCHTPAVIIQHWYYRRCHTKSTYGGSLGVRGPCISKRTWLHKPCHGSRSTDFHQREILKENMALKSDYAKRCGKMRFQGTVVRWRRMGVCSRRVLLWSICLIFVFVLSSPSLSPFYWIFMGKKMTQKQKTDQRGIRRRVRGNQRFFSGRQG